MAMVGLAPIKRQVMELASVAEIDQQRKAEGLPVGDRTMHLVMAGAPGTGKTTVARDIGRLYYALNLVDKDPATAEGFREVSGPDLIGQYKGQSGAKVKALFEGDPKTGQGGMVGGVIFVDEAYSMLGAGGQPDEYGQQAVAELLRQAENHRDNTVVILAGYGPEMDTLLSANPGLRRRFPTTLNFPEMSLDDRYEVMQGLFKKGKYVVGKGPKKQAVQHAVVDALQYTGAGNAGDVRNLFEKIETAQRVRLANQQSSQGKKVSVRDLSTITEGDVKAGTNAYIATGNVKDPIKGRLVPTSRKKKAVS